MTRVNLDDETVAKLHNLQDHLEVCNQAGRLLGYFVPAEDKAMYAEVDATISAVELDRREAEESGRQLTEILRDLKEMP